MKKVGIKYILTAFLFLPIFCLGFTFSVKPTSETCSGNGTLTFTTTDLNPNGSIVYLVYKLPDTSTPFAVVNTTFYDGLTAGDYRIIAKETVGKNTSTQQVDVTIENEISQLVYTVQSLNKACSTKSTITVIILSGIATKYEIFTGPKIFPLQTSNTFTDLPVGVYTIRVFDNCNVGVPQTYKVSITPANLTIKKPTYSNLETPVCEEIIATNNIKPAEGTIIGYPLSIKYTIHPPSGAPDIIINKSLTNGNLNSQDISVTIPQYINQNFTYDISITDICGTTYFENFEVTYRITLSEKVLNSECNQYFKLTPSNFTPPYTLNFISYPDNFNPNILNKDYPGPYNQNEVTFGNSETSVPNGDYEVTITDACGRTTNRSFKIKTITPKPNVITVNNGCLTNTGRITINLLPNYQVATAIITKAPPGYGFPLPHDVSSSINTFGVLILRTAPIGDYVILLTDTCGDKISPIKVSIPISENKGLKTEIRHGCDLQNGSIKIISKNKIKLKSVIITTAPSGFPINLPFDVSNNITSDGIFYLNNLPEGDYTFNIIDECNFNNTLDIFIEGYKIVSNTFSLKNNCGSFDIPLDFTSNIPIDLENKKNINEKFWLQKLLKNKSWGHPETGIEYVDGTNPTLSDSFPLNNHTTNYNLAYNGTFRIVHTFFSFNNGIEINKGTVTSDKNCFEIVASNLTFDEALEIREANKIPCTEIGKLDVILLANGALPLHYSIVAKNGIPFLVDNNSLNIFKNLEPAIYTFQVQDNCGGIKNRIFNVSGLVSLVVNNKPCDILKCIDTITDNETFDLTTQNSTVLGNQSPEEYILNYFTNETDVQTSSNPILNLDNFNPTTNPQTIYTRLAFSQLPNCYESSSFDLIVGQLPKLNLKAETLSCSESPVFLDSSINNLSSTTYQWSNGETTPAITVSQLGVTNISVLATNSFGLCSDVSLTCTNTKNITVNIPEIPVIEKIEIEDWTNNENSINVITSKNNSFEYSLDNINFQDSNTFINLKPDIYTVYVRNKEGCETEKQEVWLLNYPKFFTPNNDGNNDTWFIENSFLESDFKVYIYDRYGKLITSLNRNSIGWDGKYNGEQMISSDYWFVVYRQDGKIYKGHFSLVR